MRREQDIGERNVG